MLVLTFRVGPDAVGLDIRRVREVIPRVALQAVGGGPAWLAGLFLYRGRVVPVVDLHRLAGREDCPPHLSSRIILVPLGPPGEDRLLGLLASQVADLREVPDGTTLLPVAAGAGVDLGPVLADGRGMLRLLDPDTLLPADARALLAAAGGIA